MGRKGIPITVLITYYRTSEYGGFYKYIQQLIKCLADSGIKVHLVVKKDKSEFLSKKYSNIYVHHIPTNRKILFVVYSVFLLIKITIQSELQIFHSHAVDEGILSSILKSVFRKKQVLSLRANWWIWYKYKKEISKRLKRLIYILYLIFAPLIIRRADGLIVTNRRLKRIVSKISLDKPILLKQNIVDTNVFNPDKIITTLKQTPISSRPIIMYIGRLLRIKGLEYLLEAISHVRKTYPDILLILVGDGPQKAFLEKQVEQKKLWENVFFVGYQKNIAEWLSAADIFVLPSLAEGSSNVLLEAMSMGCPAITTRVGNAPDLIKHLENGLLVDPKNAKQIAENINLLLKNKVFANKIGVNARDTVIKNFSQFSVNDIIALYNKLLGFT
jgi:glycosyltransferase involved in cell wall biosynthesis